MTTELTVKKTAQDLMAERLNLSPEELKKVLKATAFKAERPVTDEEFMALIVVSEKYKLNPITKELYAFPHRGGIVPIVSVDGWVRLVTTHPEYDGVELIENMDGKEIVSVTAKFYRKDTKYPVVLTEYMAECRRGTDTWKQWPRRMLRHKAYIQGARMAFGFSGIYDEDEAERIIEVVDAPKPEPAMPKRLSEAKTPPVQEVLATAQPEAQNEASEPTIQDKAAEILGAKPTDAGETPIPAGYTLIKASGGTCRGCKAPMTTGETAIFSPTKGVRHHACA